jgi:adenosine deaminase CECR1
VHLDATVDASLLLQIALEQPALHVRTGSPLTTANLNSLQHLPEFRPLPVSEYGRGLDIASADYVPGTWVPLKEAREAFSLGVLAFDQWVMGSLTINPGEAYNTHNTVTKVGTSLLSLTCRR